MNNNSQTLICIVSDQRMQNVIPFFQEGMHFNRMALILSGKEEIFDDNYINIVDYYRLAFKNEGIIFETCECAVDPMDPEETKKACLEFCEKFGADQVVINFSGGTKPMSIGAYLAGIEKNVHMMYVDTGAEQIYLYQGSQPTIIPFHLRPISMRQILQVHGRPVDNQMKIYDKEVAELLYHNRDEPGYLSVLPYVREKLVRMPQNQNQERTLLISDLPVNKGIWSILDILKKYNLVRVEDKEIHFTEDGYKVFEGRWLEAYVFYAVSRAIKKDAEGRFGYEIGGRSVYTDVASQVVAMKDDVKNELDVVCALNGKLGIVECKSGKIYKKKEGKRKGSPAPDYLNRLSTLKQVMAGTFGQAFLVTTEEKIGYALVNRA